MAEVDDQLEIKFRLYDGSDIGPKAFPDATTVAALKETVISQWPRGQFLYMLLLSLSSCTVFGDCQGLNVSWNNAYG